jgi:hypothetical protein
VRIEGVSLDAGPFGNLGDGGTRGADASVKIDSRFDDSPPGQLLLLSALAKPVLARLRYTLLCI